MKESGENLFFLISLPRSGSTLLQHILASHSRIGATAEPWILFPSAFALRPDALSADYNTMVAWTGLKDFLKLLKNGEEQYYIAVRKMASELYGSFLAEHNKEIFLDKTSRYYMILPELVRIFPKARYVFLLRNPLALFASFLETMVCGNWKRLGEPGIRNDLLDGHRLMRQGIWYFGDDAIVVKYEDLVENPEATVFGLCEMLGIEFEPSMLNYGKAGILPGKLVDPKSIHKHQAPVKDYLDTWKSRLMTRQERYLAQAFLDHLGRELVESLGYPFDELRDAVSKRERGLAPLMRWDELTTPPDGRSYVLEWKLGIMNALENRGIIHALKFTGKKIVDQTINEAKSMRVMRPIRNMVRSIRQRKSAKIEAASTDYRIITPDELSGELLCGWQAESVAERQFEAYKRLLKDMYDGRPRRDFIVAAQALRLTNLPNPTILEIGCGNGYYSEVLSHLAHRQIEYVGLDYSRAMIESARKQYPLRRFVNGDATRLPFADNSHDITWSGTILMHLVEYKKAIEEGCRVSRRFCIFHSTPVVTDGFTTFLSKKAYGAPVVEVIISQAEFEKHLHDCGLVIRHVLESLPYGAGGVVNGTMHTLTHVCEKVL